MITTHQIIQNGTLDDLLFRGKNKAYGSYQLRKEYEYRLRRAFLLFFTTIVSIVILVPLYQRLVGNYIHVSSGTDASGTYYDPTELTHVEPILPETKPTSSFQDVKSYIDVAPVIVSHISDHEPKTQEEILSQEGVAASVNNEGVSDLTPTPDPVNVGKNDGNSLVEYGSDIPVDVAQIEPEFPGDLSKFLSEKAKFPPICEELGYTKGMVIIGFVVNEDGRISNIKLEKSDHESFNEQALKAVRAMPRWIPGSNNGQKVKVNMSIPFNFVLDN